MGRDRAPARAVLAFPFWGKSGTAHVTVQCWGALHGQEISVGPGDWDAVPLGPNSVGNLARSVPE